MMRLKATFLILFLSTFFYSIAQKETRYYEKGELALAGHRYAEALKYYTESYNINYSIEDITYKIEFLTLLLPQGDDKSLDQLLAYETPYGESDDHYYYWLGQVYMRRYQIEEAIDAFEKFHQKIAYSGNSDDESKELIAYSKQLQKFFNNPGEYEIHQLDAPINSASMEISPVYFEENRELLFASDRDGSGLTPFSIYYSKKGNDGWSPVKKVPNLGSFTKENANIEVVNNDGKLFLFREEKGGDLFYSTASGDDWTIPVEFDARISNNHLASHFFINEHEDRIIFSSDEGDAGLDIYESFRNHENGKWSKPSPFYSTINTEFDEDSPYLSPDENRLYFSSKRPGGIGGYDIYASKYNPEDYSWSEPVNLGWPINSPNDELHFKLNEDQESGYFVSDRTHTKGGFDIYFFWEAEQIKIEGRIFDESAGKALSNALIKFHPSQYLDESFTSRIDETGRYSTNIIAEEVFMVEIIKDGKVIHSDQFEIHEASGEPTTYFKNFSVKY
ncbi:MAG: PD40 domain-containing protein [Cyclobacteriaceae bacterium]